MSKLRLLASSIGASAVCLLAVAVSGPAVAQSAPAKAAAAPIATPAPPGEEAVDSYTVSNDNAGATPFTDPGMLAAFHGKEGISRIVDALVESVQKDERTTEVFHASDFVRLRRTLKEQFCYILGGGCDYTGRSMTKVHEDHGITVREFGALVEQLQDAMDREGVPFTAQNRFLAKLAPMKRDTVKR